MRWGQSRMTNYELNIRSPGLSDFCSAVDGLKVRFRGASFSSFKKSHIRYRYSYFQKQAQTAINQSIRTRKRWGVLH